MFTMKGILGKISGGKVLDVATGGGNFVQVLIENLKDFDEIIGIDSNEKAEVIFDETFTGDPRITFQLMDACEPAFPQASFDTVCISNSLHHFKDPKRVLQGMIRILQPGGTLIVSEMIQDGQTEPQLTHVKLHHWWAAVDRMNDIVHNETYQRMELIKLVRNTGLEAIEYFDLCDCEDDPLDPQIMAELEPVIERYMQRAGDDKRLLKSGEELRERIKNVGFHSATTLVLTGRKPQTK